MIFLLTCWMRGFVEFRSTFDRTYGHPFTDQSIAYGQGRDMAHRLTLRRFDQ